MITDRKAAGHLEVVIPALVHGLATPPDVSAVTETRLVREKQLEFISVYEEHFDFVWRSVRRLGVSTSAVDDVVQDIFVIVHRQLSGFEGRSSLKTWLFGIARRVVRDHFRSLNRKRFITLQDQAIEVPLDDESGPSDAAEKNQALALLHKLLDQLDDDKREVFVLAELEQMTVPEIAEALGVNMNTVYSRIRSARQSFDQVLARHRARDEWRAL